MSADEVAVCKLCVPHSKVPRKCSTRLTSHDNTKQTGTVQSVVASQEWRSQADICWQERSVGRLSPRGLMLGHQAPPLLTLFSVATTQAQLQRHVACCSHHHQWMPACVPVPSAQHMACPNNNRAVVKTHNTRAHLLCTHECTRKWMHTGTQLLCTDTRLTTGPLSSKASGTLTRRHDASGATLVTPTLTTWQQHSMTVLHT